MRTMINDVICDTETAKRIVSAVISGVDVHGDVTETLYRTHAGRFFLHAVGGADTDCAAGGEPGERISLITHTGAVRWVRSNVPEEEARLVLTAWLGVRRVLSPAASREIAKRLLEEQELSGNADPDSIREELRSFFSLDED
ncbi:MAG: hypothetical protein PHP22_10390 [Oscillospiraceae bacterium]|nr:hypothetical protein [Oscillospiraceae bacterium]